MTTRRIRRLQTELAAVESLLERAGPRLFLEASERLDFSVGEAAQIAREIEDSSSALSAEDKAKLMQGLLEVRSQVVRATRLLEKAANFYGGWMDALRAQTGYDTAGKPSGLNVFDIGHAKVRELA